MKSLAHHHYQHARLNMMLPIMLSVALCLHVVALVWTHGERHRRYKVKALVLTMFFLRCAEHKHVRSRHEGSDVMSMYQKVDMHNLAHRYQDHLLGDHICGSTVADVHACTCFAAQEAPGHMGGGSYLHVQNDEQPERVVVEQANTHTDKYACSCAQLVYLSL